MFDRVLIANRGEIALRIVRTLREMGISSVAVYSDADRDSRFVLEADEAYRIGPPPAPESYLSQKTLIEIAFKSKAQAIHPGYGFLAENVEFAGAVNDSGLTFIGPSATSMRLMGDKIAARKIAVENGVPIVPGTAGAIQSIDQAEAFASEHGLPVLVKAGGGGGGRGIRIVDDATQLSSALEAAAREAGTYFGNSAVYLERLYTGARHIEVQIAGDGHGKVVAWGERDCSTQRRRQKLIEETPAPGLPPDDRTALLDHAVRLAMAVNYVGVGTVEFLYVGQGAFYFLEMNTRIQVEHTITEQVTGLDLVAESIILAAGDSVTSPTEPRGHAIEARINAEDPRRGFQPGPGRITLYREPGGPGVRVDSGVYEGFTVPGDYDSLVSKLVAHAPTREQAIDRLLRALHGYTIIGIPTTIRLIADIVNSLTFRAGRVTTDWLDSELPNLLAGCEQEIAPGEEAASARVVGVEVNGKRFEVRVFDPDKNTNGSSRPRPSGRQARKPQDSNSVLSPMRGTVLSIVKEAGDTVAEGERLMVVEAMKMENEVRSPRSGTIGAVLVAIGDTVESHQPLMELAP